ncbi:MAG: hypothetical protein Q9212_003011 [Teloschistes hypoglaucus]
MDFVLPTVLFFAFLHAVDAAPSRNLTALRTDFAPPFVREPDGRGTWSLLYSCLFTLAICVWTAYHPNVKSSSTSPLGKLRLKLKWIFLTILVPELGVLTAFKQNRKVNSLVAVLSRLRATTAQRNASKVDGALGSESHAVYGAKEGDLERGSSSPLPFSKTYGFFVLMGGLSVDVSHLHDRLQTVVLTSSGVQRLAETGCFFDVSDQDIQDKSKADFLAKGLVLLQISWTILQCLSRKAVGLPLSILEVHILVHAGCALIMYILWFDKPLDIDEPIKVHIPDEILALMLVQSYGFGMPPYGKLAVPLEFKPARLFGPKFGVWPTRFASESSYLMFNSYSPSGAPKQNRHNVDPYDETFTPRRSKTSIRSQPRAPRIEQTEFQSRIKLMTVGFEHRVETTHQDAQPGQSTATKEHISEDSAADGHDMRSETQRHSGDCSLSASSIEITNILDQSPSANSSVVEMPSPKSNICYGISSGPQLGIEVCRQITTGEFLTGGIGPNAFFVGDWTGLRGNQIHDSIRVVQVPDDLRSRLPIPHVDTSTITNYCPLTLSLSRKDFRRWQYAGLALQADSKATVQTDSNRTAFMDINSSGSTPEGAYFITESKIIDYVRPYADAIADSDLRVPHGAQSRAVLMRSLYKRCLETEEFKLGSTSGVTMLPGVLYGALHLSLWNSAFPSSVERLLWRMSGVVLIAVPMLVAFLLALWTFLPKYFVTFLLALRTLWPKYFVNIKLPQAETSPDPSQTSKVMKMQSSQGQARIHMQTGGSFTSENPVISTDKISNRREEAIKTVFTIKDLILLEVRIVLFWVITAFYVFSRVFIIVESFISLRHVPVGVYKDVGWSKYIPHF